VNFLDIFSKNAIISNFGKIRPVKVVFFLAGERTDGQTDMTNHIVAMYKNCKH